MRILFVMLITVSVAFGQGKPSPQQGPPPKNLTQKADGHFTANEDPANPEKFEVHTVKAGDTLSAISGQYLKNPRLWPQLWEQNEHIVNPHWIYPNDKILIKPVTQITEAKPPEPTPSPEPAEPVAAREPAPPPRPAMVNPRPQAPPVQPRPAVQFDLRTPRVVPEIKATDMYCSGFVRYPEVPENLKVTATYDSTAGAFGVEGQYVYMSRGAEDGIRVGTVFQVIRPTKRIEGYSQSGREQDLGRHYLDIAQIQVVSAQPDFSMARVVTSCEPTEIGDIMVPFQRLEAPQPPPRRPFSPMMRLAGAAQGEIVMTKNALLNFGSAYETGEHLPGARPHSESLSIVEYGVAAEGSIVYVNLGQSSGVKPGDVFLVYRGIEVPEHMFHVPRESHRLEYERVAIGEIVILKVDALAATALVTYSPGGVSARDVVARR